jgi:hypothetical protein
MIAMKTDWSPNLTAFVKEKPHAKKILYDPKERVYWIGYTDVGGRWHGAARFLDVLCRGSKARTQAFSNEMNDRLVDRTDQFVRCVNHFGKWMFRNWYWDTVTR